MANSRRRERARRTTRASRSPVARRSRARIAPKWWRALTTRLALARERVASASARARARFGAAYDGALKIFGFALAFAIVSASHGACACARGAFIGGALAIAGFALGCVASVVANGNLGVDAREFTIGYGFGVFPALAIASASLSPWNARAPSAMEGQRANALSRESANADAVGLIDVAIGDFRFDLMGEYNTTRPREDAKYMFAAGAEASGTICAVPVTHGAWTKDDTVPFWHVCDNDWQGHRSCARAYGREYNDKYEWYGSRALGECLRAPVEALKANPGAELYFLHLDFSPSFESKHDESERALQQASAKYEVSIDTTAPRMYFSPYQEPCCGALRRADDALLLGVTLASVAPLIYLVIRDVLKAVMKRPAKRAFKTRAELMGAKSKAAT